MQLADRHTPCMPRPNHELSFIPIRQAAFELGVPVAWLKREAEHNRVPAVRAGRRWLVHLKKTEQRLLERAERGISPPLQGGNER